MRFALATLVFVIALSVAPVSSVQLAPGESSTIFGTADPFAGATLLATISTPFASFDFSGILTQNVYSGGSLPGVSFRYTIVTDSLVGAAAIAGLQTNVDYVFGTGTSDNPLTASRQANGNSVGFTWATNEGVPPRSDRPVTLPRTAASPA